MAYKGDIPAKTLAKVKLSADFSNSGSAVLMVGSGAFGNDPTANSAVVAPGGSASLQLQTPAAGLVKIVVDFQEEDDSGVIEVTAGKFKQGAPVKGDVNWTYSA